MSITYRVLVINKNDETLQTKYEEHNVNYIRDVGVDLFTPDDITVPANAISFKIGLGIKCTGIKDNKNISYMIFPRSSMGAKTPLRLCNSIGLVDPDYTGELMAYVDNMSNSEYKINRMDRLVQLVGPSHEQPKVQLVEELENTERGERGIGSSGR